MRDYALNNMMLMAMCDGIISDAEKANLNSMAKKTAELLNQV
jgi:hypothetical protein